MLDRIKLGDTHCPRDDGTCRRTPAWPDSNALLLGVPNEVRGHEEVARKAHLAHHRDFVLRLLAVGLRHWPTLEAFDEAPLDLLHQPGVLGLSIGNGELRHEVGTLVELHVATFSYLEGVVAGLREFGPQGSHLGRRLQIELVAGEFEPLGVIDHRPSSHAEERIVRCCILLAHVVQVVGREQRQAEGSSDLEQVLTVRAFDRDAVIHQFAVEVALAEDVLIVGSSLERLVVSVGLQPAVDFT